MSSLERYKNDEENNDPLRISSYYGDQTIVSDPGNLLDVDLSAPNSPTSIKPRGIEEIYDENDPKQWNKAKKYLVLLFNCFGGMLVGLSHTIFYPVIPMVSNEFDFTEEFADVIGTKPPSPSKSKNQRFFNPLSPLSSLYHPNTFLTIIYLISVSQILYLQDTLLLYIFVVRYNLSINDSIMVFLVISLGCIAGCLVGGMYSDLALRKSKPSGDSEVFHAERRINSIWFAAALVPLVYPLCGWSLQERWFVLIPIGAMYFGGFAIYWLLIANSTYLIDINPTKSSSVTALNNSTRFIIGGIITVFTVPLHKLTSIGWVFTIASGVNLLCILLLVIVLLKGEKWREESK
ncbi:15992_t:CDS:2 [Acaulospora colombiana]|uniref:15992_t:CDS:1 n=1 Tax=Acaulospora colombiana TaxID=27376 RepID=A0ACA9KB41_9GLOM|nr:15992_t:CDS:2 [Acaulospora colombiana]